MSSTFKNRIPKRKYRERVQPESRQHLGFLQKKKDYKVRAKNYHEKQDMLNKFKLKAKTKNQDEFYFKMLKAKKNQDGIHVEDDGDDDFDQNKYRAALKTQNYSIAMNQKAIITKKIQRLQADLQMIGQIKSSSHKVFVADQQQYNNFEPHQYFKTTKQLADSSILEANPKYLQKHNIQSQLQSSVNLKHKYTRLAEYQQKAQVLQKILNKLSYDKNLLTKDRKKIKKFGKNKKIHKFFMQRKK